MSFYYFFCFITSSMNLKTKETQIFIKNKNSINFMSRIQFNGVGSVLCLMIVNRVSCV